MNLCKGRAPVWGKGRVTRLATTRFIIATATKLTMRLIVGVAECTKEEMAQVNRNARKKRASVSQPRPLKVKIIKFKTMLVPYRSRPRPARLRISAEMPNVQGAILSQWFTRLVSVPSLGELIDTRSPTMWVKP
jgi:hypothetical protein